MTAPIHPDELDELIHQKVRLVILSALAARDEMSFGELKELTGATDGNLSVHLRVLEDADYLNMSKGFVGRRPHTSYCLTEIGRAAFKTYLATLAKLVGSSGAEKQE